MIKLFQFFRNLGLISANKTGRPFPEQLLILWTYLKLKLIQRMFFLFFIKKKKKIRLLNFDLNYLNFDIVVSLFEDLFIENEYFVEIKEKQPTIINVGANIGLTTIYFKYLYPRAKILAFEPDPISFNILKKNVTDNNFYDIELENSAVSDKTGKEKFYYDRENNGALLMSLEKKRLMNSRSRTVKTVQLSTFIKQSIDLIKIDVEGAEQKIIDDLSKSKKIRFVNRLIIEYHHHIDLSEDKFSQIISFLEQNGFGYQIVTKLRSPINYKNYQDILIYAYNKNKKNN